MVGQENRIQVTGWRKRHGDMLKDIFENMHPKLRAAFADADGRMNQSAMIRYCIQEVHNRMTDEAEKGGTE